MLAQPNIPIDAYEMPRLSSFLGREMRHSGWYPDYVLRLFRREKAGFPMTSCMSTWSVRAPSAGWADLIHHPVHRLEDALSRMDRYSSAGAEQLVASGRKVSFISGFIHGIFAFLRTYVLAAASSMAAKAFSSPSPCGRNLLPLHESLAGAAPSTNDADRRSNAADRT